METLISTSFVFHIWSNNTPLSMTNETANDEKLRKRNNPSTWPQKKRKVWHFQLIRNERFNSIEQNKKLNTIFSNMKCILVLLDHQMRTTKFLRFFLTLKMKRNTKHVSWLFKQFKFITTERSEKSALNDFTWCNKAETCKDKPNWLPHNQCYAIFITQISLCELFFSKSKNSDENEVVGKILCLNFITLILLIQ